MHDYIIIGKLIKAQGIKGEVKVFPMTNHLDRFYDLEQVYLSEFKPYDKRFEEIKLIKNNIIKIRVNNNLVYLTFNEVTNRDKAESLKNKYIVIPKELAIKLDEDEYFIDDIIGCKIITKEDKEIGTIKDVITTLSNDIYVVEKNKKECFIPAIKDVVKSIDIKNKIVKIEMMEGLI